MLTLLELKSMKLIHLSKKLLKSDTSKDSLLSISGQGVAAISGFIFTAIATNAISLREFGYFSLALATAAIIKDVIDPAINATMVKFVPISKESAEQITRYVIKIKLLYFGLVLGVGFLFATFFSQLIFKTEWPFLMVMTLITAATLSTGALLSGFFQSHKEFLNDSLFVSAQPLLRLLFVSLAIWVGYTGVIEFLVVNVLAYLVVIGLFASRITYEFISGEVEPTTQSSANSFIRPLTASTIIGTLIDRVGLYITNYLLGPEAVGVLAVIMRLFIPAQQIAGVLQSVFGTRFARFTSDKQVNEYIKKTLLVITPVATGALLTMPIAGLILGVFGKEYIFGTGVLRIITLGFIGFLFQVPFVGKLMYYKNRVDILVIISLIQLVLVTALDWVLITWWGLIGAGIAISTTMISVSFLYVITSNLVTKR